MKKYICLALEVLAEGTYKNVGEELTLTFTMDNITNGALDVVELHARMEIS